VPTPAKTSIEDIVATGRSILETEGPDALTLQRIAGAVGVKAPSLYKRVASRGDVIQRIANDAAAELGDRLVAAGGSGDPGTDLRAMAHAARSFARDHPRAYALIFAPLPEGRQVDPELNRRAIDALFRVVGELAEPADVLEAGRLVVAWLQGFVSMEQAGAFRLGGDVDAAFDYGLDRILAGLTSADAHRPSARDPGTGDAQPSAGRSAAARSGPRRASAPE
jgi:AcrR family transcriptional regulator